MKAIAKNAMAYTGIVTLSQYIGSKKVKIAEVHNKGNTPLFNFFADCLMGDFETAKINRPTKIMLLHKNDTDEYESRSGFIYQTNKPEKDATSGTVTYGFTLPSNIISKLDSTDINCVGLYSNSTREDEFSDYSALVTFNFDNPNIAAASALLIDWKLIVANKNEGN